MRVKVVKSFRDKHTNALHKAGTKIEVSRERYDEINSAALGPFVEEIKQVDIPPVLKPNKKTTKK
ncbi:MAG: hypothetical protein N2376_03765 [Clostridia bacterium]|nr:hypothetical protein [Clostridia bacterium]